jgi:hypothetical protein
VFYQLPQLVKNRNHWEHVDKSIGTSATSNKLPPTVFVGIARDIRTLIQFNMDNLLRLAAFEFEDYRFIIIENDSVDGTAEYLQSLASDKIATHCYKESMKPSANFGGLGGLKLKRFQVITYWRNKYMEKLRSDTYKDFPYVAVVDLDHYVGTYPSAVRSCFEREDWDMVSSNGMGSENASDYPVEIAFTTFDKPRYYDTLAFRNKKMERFKNKTQKGSVGVLKHVHFHPNTPWEPVTSAFGGMAFYRREALMAANYDSYDCEHVCLHDNMIKAGFDRMYINPNFILRH